MISRVSPSPQRSALALFGFVAPCAIALAIAIGDATRRPVVLALAIALAALQVLYLGYGKPGPRGLGDPGRRRAVHRRGHDARDGARRRHAASAALHLRLLERPLASQRARRRERRRDDRRQWRAARRARARLGCGQRGRGPWPSARVRGGVRAGRRSRVPPGHGAPRRPCRGGAGASRVGARPAGLGGGGRRAAGRTRALRARRSHRARQRAAVRDHRASPPRSSSAPRGRCRTGRGVAGRDHRVQRSRGPGRPGRVRRRALPQDRRALSRHRHGGRHAATMARAS